MPGKRYWDPVPSSPSQPRGIFLRLPDQRLGLTTDRGVFSRARIDPGTRILLREAPAPPAVGEILDLGAGYGPIAITLALRFPRARVWGVDVNQRALDLLRKNAQECGATNVVAAFPEEVPNQRRFAAIYSNPPIKIGKEALRDLLLRWLGRLLPGAHAYLVVKKNLGSDTLAEWLTERGYPTARLGSKQGYRVLDAWKGG
jgi:16S rRNA (guanine1207-N2)-methyltransferase